MGLDLLPTVPSSRFLPGSDVCGEHSDLLGPLLSWVLAEWLVLAARFVTPVQQVPSAPPLEQAGSQEKQQTAALLPESPTATLPWGGHSLCEVGVRGGCQPSDLNHREVLLRRTHRGTRQVRADGRTPLAEHTHTPLKTLQGNHCL